jgi:hypothetical protein
MFEFLGSLFSVRVQVRFGVRGSGFGVPGFEVRTPVQIESARHDDASRCANQNVNMNPEANVNTNRLLRACATASLAVASAEAGAPGAALVERLHAAPPGVI